jgi:hypothetical protein
MIEMKWTLSRPLPKSSGYRELPRFLDVKEFKMADEVINAKRREFLKMSGQNCAENIEKLDCPLAVQ